MNRGDESDRSGQVTKPGETVTKGRPFVNVTRRIER